MNEHDATATDPKADPHPHAAPPQPAGEETVSEAEAGTEGRTEPAPPPSPEEIADAGTTGESAVAETPVPTADAHPSAPESAHEPESAATPSEESKAEADPVKPAKRAKSPKAVAVVAATHLADAEVAAPDEPADAATPAEPPAEAPPENKKKWYAIKVQSGREDTIKAAILRKVAIEGLEEHFGQIMIPYEEEVIKKTVRVKDKKSGEYTTQEKKVTRKKKKFQGYLFAELEFNDRILYLFRETSGVGDFLNLRTKPGQQPTPEPMPEHEVQSMLTGERHADPLKKGNAKVRLDFEKGDRVRIREGPFANNEGEVKVISEPKDPTDTPKVTVIVTLWGRPVDVDLDYWQVEKA